MTPPDMAQLDDAPDDAPQQSNAAVWIILAAVLVVTFAAGFLAGVMWCAI